MAGQRNYMHEEHVAWTHAMFLLQDECGVDVNSIPRENFVPFEEALREWAVAYVRSVPPPDAPRESRDRQSLLGGQTQNFS